MEDVKVKVQFRNYKDVVRTEKIWLSELNGSQECSSSKIITNFKFSNHITTDLISVELPEGIETIEESAFAGYRNLETIVLPNSLKVIENQAFSDCWNLKMPKLPPKIEKVDFCAFVSIEKDTTIELPKSLKSFDGMSFGEAKLIVNPKSPYFCQTEDGLIYSIDKKELIWAPIDIENATVAENTKVIQNAFQNRFELKTVKLPDSVEKIEAYAFDDCNNLESFTIPSKLALLDEGIFYDTGLTELLIPSNIESVESGAFGNCRRIKQITIPKTVKEISPYAFEDRYNLGS